MEALARPSSDPAPQFHSARFYEASDSLTESAAEFLRYELAHGAAILIACHPDRWPALSRRICQSSDQLGRWISSGRVVAIDAQDFAEKAGADPGTLKALFQSQIAVHVENLHARGARIGAFGEIVDVLWKLGHGELVTELEHLWHRLLGRSGARLMCGYELCSFAGHESEWDLICDQHTEVGLAEESEIESLSVAARKEVLRLKLHSAAYFAEVAHSARVAHIAELEEMNSELAHEMANRLTVVSLSHDRLRKMITDAIEGPAPLAPALETLDQLDSIIDRTRQVLERTTNLARKAPPVLESFEFADFLEQAIARFLTDRGVGAERIELSRPIEDARVLGSPEALEQVFWNLFGNAFDAFASASRYAVAKVQVAVALSDDGRLLVDVRDEGPGMKDEVRERIFAPFFTTKPSDSGTGLGLSICQRILAQHGGALECRSVEGLGSTFTVSLPRF